MLRAIQGVIDRRILVNYRIDASLLAEVLPDPFRPKLHQGHGMGGVCLIRLKNERPSGLPASVGFSSENAAHRFAVEWDDNGTIRDGVFVPRRDTSSWLSTTLGGRLFPGDQNLASFEVEEHDDFYSVAMMSKDGESSLSFAGSVAASLPDSSIFASTEEASRFFERGAVGYSATEDQSQFDGIELETTSWRVEPLSMETATSSLFDDSPSFPSGSAVFDNALLMRDIEHKWLGLDQLCCTSEVKRS